MAEPGMAEDALLSLSASWVLLGGLRIFGLPAIRLF